MKQNLLGVALLVTIILSVFTKANAQVNIYSGRPTGYITDECVNSGTIHWDATTSTLTLDNLVYKSTVTVMWSSCFSISTPCTLNLVGRNTIIDTVRSDYPHDDGRYYFTSTWPLCIYSDVTITSADGKGSLKILSDSAGIWLLTSNGVTQTLTIKDCRVECSSVDELWQGDGWADYGYGISGSHYWGDASAIYNLVIDNATVRLKGKDASLYAINGLTLNNCAMVSPTSAVFLSPSGTTEGGVYTDLSGTTLVTDTIVIEPTTFKMNSLGYASYSSTAMRDFTSISGLTAYIVTAASSSSVTLTPVTGPVPANTGLILRGTPGTTYNIPINNTATPISVSGNLLVATTSDYTLATGDYYLGNDGTTTGFYEHTTSTTLTVPAGGAYLPGGSVTAKKSFLSFEIKGEPTAISELVETKEETAMPVYNLSGQRVNNTYKGIVVKNGKKYIK